MSEWKTIDSAPRDGTNIILLVEDKAIEGRYYKYETVIDGERGSWDYVSLNSHGCGCCGEPDSPPTHWMPLPEAPK